MTVYLKALKILFPAIKNQKKLASFFLIGILTLIGLSVAFNEWRGFFYNNIQTYNIHKVWLGVCIFIGLALVNVFVSGLLSYFTRFLEFNVRSNLYDIYKTSTKEVPNKDQRLQEDCLRFSKTSIALIQTLLDSLVRLPIFLIILWEVASWWMVLIVLVYACLGTVFSKKVANKLIDLEFLQEQKEANLRRNIIRSIEEKTEMPTLKEICENWTALAFRNKLLAYYTSFYQQVAVILPFIMLLPMYLNHAILLGVLFQTSSAIEQILGSLSVLVDNRAIVVDLSMVTKRLGELQEG